MTIRPNGDDHFCDCCGADVGNGGIDQCIIVSTLDREAGTSKIFHFCLDREENDVQVAGCASSILSPERLTAYRENHG